MKKWGLLAVIVLLLAAVPTAWAEELPGDLAAALPPEASVLVEEAQSEAGADALLPGMSRLGRTALSEFRRLLGSELKGTAVLVIAALLCGLFESLHGEGEGGGRVVTVAGALTVTAAAAGDVRSMLGLGAQSVEQMALFAQTLLPTLAAATASGGAAATAGTAQVATVYFTGVLISLIRYMLLPLVGLFVGIAAAGAMLPEHDLHRLQAGLSRLITVVLTSLLAVFTTALTLFRAVGSAVDGTALRLTRSAISAAVPVVGSIVSDAAESVLAGAMALKSAVGVFGMLGVLSICLLPFVRLAVQYLAYKLAALLAATVGSKPLVSLIDSLGSAFGLVLGMCGACALLLLISVSTFVSVVT